MTQGSNTVRRIQERPAPSGILARIHGAKWNLIAVITAILVSACGSSGSSNNPAAPKPDAFPAAFNAASEVEGIRSLLVSQDGILVREEYFNGGGPDRVGEVWSVTKSVTSALVGIAIEQGHIENVDQTLGDFLVSPEFDELDDSWAEVTVENLLTMTGGHEWVELGGSSEYNVWVNSPDQIDYILSKPVVNPPGTLFDYSDGGAHLVSVVLGQATGMTAHEFARQQLFEPLGIDDSQWIADNRGYNIGGARLRISPRAMLAFGNMYLNGGTSGGRQIVPAGWVATSTRAHVSTGNAVPYGASYGYFWWLGNAAGRDIHFATGYGGQFIVIVPELRMVVVATCYGWFGIDQSNANWSSIMRLIVNDIVAMAE